MKIINLYQCEICDKVYGNLKEAEICEEKGQLYFPPGLLRFAENIYEGGSEEVWCILPGGPFFPNKTHDFNAKEFYCGTFYGEWAKKNPIRDFFVPGFSINSYSPADAFLKFLSWQTTLRMLKWLEQQKITPLIWQNSTIKKLD